MTYLLSRLDHVDADLIHIVDIARIHALGDQFEELKATLDRSSIHSNQPGALCQLPATTGHRRVALHECCEPLLTADSGWIEARTLGDCFRMRLQFTLGGIGVDSVALLEPFHDERLQEAEPWRRAGARRRFTSLLETASQRSFVHADGRAHAGDATPDMLELLHGVVHLAPISRRESFVAAARQLLRPRLTGDGDGDATGLNTSRRRPPRWASCSLTNY